MATIVAAGVIDSGIETLNNIATDPRATSGSRWNASAGTGGVIGEAMVTGAVDGPLLPDGSMWTKYARYTWTTASTSGTPYAEYIGSNAETHNTPIGTPVAMGIYARSSVARNATHRGYGSNQADAVIWTSVAPPTTALPAGTWVRVATVFSTATATQVMDYFRNRLEFPGQTMPLGATLDITLALITPNTLTIPDHFDGDTDDAHWLGVPNASASALDYVIEPLLILDYGYQNQSRNVILDLLGSEYPAVFLRPAASKSGTLSMLFGSNETARAAQQILMLATRYSFDEEAAGEGFDFVRAGAVTVQKVVGIDYWITNVEFREVAAL